VIKFGLKKTILNKDVERIEKKPQRAENN